jgi:hypothetical protein
MALITVPEIELDELLPVPELVPPAAPPLPLVPEPEVEPADDPVPEPVAPDEPPGAAEPLEPALTPEPACEAGVVGVDGLLAAVLDEPVLPQTISSGAEPRTAALRRLSEVRGRAAALNS